MTFLISCIAVAIGNEFWLILCWMHEYHRYLSFTYRETFTVWLSHISCDSIIINPGITVSPFPNLVFSSSAGFSFYLIKGFPFFRLSAEYNNLTCFWLQLRKMLDLLVHASQCRSPHCQYPNCRKVKGLFRHGIQCRVRASGGCVLCKKMWYLLQLHARACKESECHVPRCRFAAKLFVSSHNLVPLSIIYSISGTCFHLALF